MGDILKLAESNRRKAIKEHLHRVRPDWQDATIRWIVEVVNFGAKVQGQEVSIVEYVAKTRLSRQSVHNAISLVNKMRNLDEWLGMFVYNDDKKSVTFQADRTEDPMAEEAETRRRNGSRSKLVLEYFMQYPGQMLTASQVAEGTGLDSSQVRGAVRKMIEDGTTGAWEVNLRGNAWTYHSHPAGARGRRPCSQVRDPGRTAGGYAGPAGVGRDHGAGPRGPDVQLGVLMNQWLVFVLILWVSTGTMITVVETAKVLKGRSK